MKHLELLEHTDTINELLARYGVRFGIYKNNEFKEQLFPFDAIPRVIEQQEFAYLEKGLKQRVVALNLFLKDICDFVYRRRTRVKGNKSVFLLVKKSHGPFDTGNRVEAGIDFFQFDSMPHMLNLEVFSA